MKIPTQLSKWTVITISQLLFVVFLSLTLPEACQTNWYDVEVLRLQKEMEIARLTQLQNSNDAIDKMCGQLHRKVVVAPQDIGLIHYCAGESN